MSTVCIEDSMWRLAAFEYMYFTCSNSENYHRHSVGIENDTMIMVDSENDWQENSAYILLNPFSSAWYTGKVCGRDASCREYEHFSRINRFMAPRSQLPAYRHIRLFPCGLWLLLPVISLIYSSNFELLTLEHDQIRCSASPLNWPYVKKLVHFNEDSLNHQKPVNLTIEPSSIASKKMKLPHGDRKKFWKYSISR